MTRRELLRAGVAVSAGALASGPLSALAAGKQEFAREGSKGFAKSLRVNPAYFQAVNDVFKGRVPAWLLQSISSVESGHHVYVFNVDGTAIMPSSKDEALRVLSKIGPVVEIGHQKESLLDPWTNTLAAGTILGWLLKGTPTVLECGRQVSLRHAVSKPEGMPGSSMGMHRRLGFGLEH